MGCKERSLPGGPHESVGLLPIGREEGVGVGGGAVAQHTVTSTAQIPGSKSETFPMLPMGAVGGAGGVAGVGGTNTSRGNDNKRSLASKLSGR